MFEKLKKILKYKWKEEGGLKELLYISFPLILSSSTITIQHFVDRLFLAWYSPTAIASSMTAQLFQYTLLSVFIGTAHYTSTFVAQYYGAKIKDNIGRIVWQGIYVSLIGFFFVLFTSFYVEDFFRFLKHSENIIAYETTYYRILSYGSFFALAISSLSGYFSGQGKTIPIFVGNLIGAVVNIFFDYVLIFGKFGFPSLGVAGAAIATNLSFISIMFFYLFLMLLPNYKKEANFFAYYKFEKKLFLRLIEYGFPNGLQFFVEMAGYSIFLLLVGSLKEIYFSATTIAFNINNFAFMPLLGLGMGISVLVGQSIGAKKFDVAEKSTYSGLLISYVYIVLICSSYLLFPSFFSELFRSENVSEFEEIKMIVNNLLKFVAFYSIFDNLNIVFSGALRGSGDTKFLVKIVAFISFFVLILPTYIIIYLLNGGIYLVWVILSIEVSLLGLIFFIRFKTGIWKKINLIRHDCVS